jgi:hypothetical protein
MGLKSKALYAEPAVGHVVKKNDSRADRILDYGAGLRQCARMHPIHFYPRLAGVLWLLMSGLVLAAPAAPGTNYLIRGWQIENGLPQNKLTALLQAPDGYMYIETASGLVRHPGECLLPAPPTSPQLM